MNNDFPFAEVIEKAATIKDGSTLEIYCDFWIYGEKDSRYAEMALVSVAKEDRGPWAFSVLRYFCSAIKDPNSVIISSDSSALASFTLMCEEIVKLFVRILDNYNVQIPETHYKTLVSMYGEDFITSLGLPRAIKREKGKKAFPNEQEAESGLRFERQRAKLEPHLETLKTKGYLDGDKKAGFKCVRGKLNQQIYSDLLRILLEGEEPCTTQWRKYTKSTNLFKEKEVCDSEELKKIILNCNFQDFYNKWIKDKKHP